MKRVAVLLLLAALARADDEKPLPLRKTVTLASGGKYFVEGRQEIRWGQELTVQKGTKIVGRGPGAILVVSGALQMHGVEGDEVAIEDMLILIDERCRQLQFDSVKVNRCVIRTPDKKTSMATLQFEECDLFRTTLELRLHKGEVTMLNCKVSGPIRIAAVARPGEKAAVKALFNTSNIDRDLVIQGLNSVVVRACSINGQPVSFLDCAVLTFDANVVKSGTIVFEQSKAGQFKKTKLQKSDFHDTRLFFKAPPEGKKQDRIPIDKCWFGGLTKKDEILKKYIEDGHSKETTGVFVVFRKINKRELGLGGRTTKPR